MVDDSRVNKRRRRVQQSKGMSTDPLDWINISSLQDVPYKQQWVYSDEPSLSWKPDRTDNFWWSRFNAPAEAMSKAEHREPKGMKEIGFGGFWGDYRMEGSIAWNSVKKGHDIQTMRVNTQRRLAKGYQEAGCNKCGQVIKVRVAKNDPKGNHLYSYDTLAWDIFPGQEKTPVCKNCNTAMSYNFKLEKFRKSAYKSYNTRTRPITRPVSSVPAATPSKANGNGNGKKNGNGRNGNGNGNGNGSRNGNGNAQPKLKNISASELAKMGYVIGVDSRDLDKAQTKAKPKNGRRKPKK
jgi:hypothetical protein